jgi:ComF family protein
MTVNYFARLAMSFKNLLSVFIKENCPLCQRAADNTFCRDCQRRLFAVRFSNPSQFWWGEIPVFAWGNYGGELKRAIAACKYENRPAIAASLGFWLGEAWRNSQLFVQYPKAIVIPIPLHQNKLASRGFNQAEIIARSFCQVTNYIFKKDGVLRQKDTEAMFGLLPTARVANIRDAFILGKDFQRELPRLPILSIDDIYTTGTTVKEVAKTLDRSGLKLIGIAVVSKAIQ